MRLISGFSRSTSEHSVSSSAVAHSGQLDALVVLEQIGARRLFTDGQEIYVEGDAADCWYRVISGAVRTCKLLVDGRRHIAQFCFAGDCFGLPAIDRRTLSAEAIGHAIVMRYSQRATDHLIAENPRLARDLYNRSLRELAEAQKRMLLLGRMLASERVANFLLEISERQDARGTIHLPMSRSDIADYLGLRIETVCRELSKFKRGGIIASQHKGDRIELRNRESLEGLCEACV